MPYEHPSDYLKLPGFEQLTVGDARDFLERPTAGTHPLHLLKIAKGLQKLLHEQMDYTGEGYKILQLGKKEQRDLDERVDRFLKMTPEEFPEEEPPTGDKSAPGTLAGNQVEDAQQLLADKLE